MTAEPFSLDLQLSSSEMLYLQDALSLAALPGGTSADSVLAADTASTWRLAGLNALRARNLIYDDHAARQMVVDRMLAGMLIACGEARKAIFVERSGANEAQSSSCLHMHHALAVVHRRERPGIDRFIALFDETTIATQFRQEVPLASTGTHTLAPIKLARQTFGAVLDALGAGQTMQALDVLTNAEHTVQAASAEALLQALVQPHMHISVMAVATTDAPGQQKYARTFLLIDTPEGVWLIELDQDATTTTVGRITREQASAQLDPLIANVSSFSDESQV